MRVIANYKELLGIEAFSFPVRFSIGLGNVALRKLKRTAVKK